MLEFPGGRGSGGKSVWGVCWKDMSEMWVVCWKMPGSCNIAIGKAKMGAEMMRKLLVGHLARLCESFLKVETGCGTIFSRIL